MSKGQTLKIKDSICNVPINNTENNCNFLPQPSDKNGIIIVKLKKIENRGGVLCEPVRRNFVKQLLDFRCSKKSFFTHLWLLCLTVSMNQ